MNDERNQHEAAMGEGPAQQAPPYVEAGPPAPGAPPGGAGAGWTPPRASRAPRKSPALASFFSVMPGLGQIYVGYYQRGFIHIIIVAAVITLLASGDMTGLEPLLGLFLAFFWLYNIIDAGRRAGAYNRLAEGGKMDELPELTDQVGGKFTGGVLVGFGLILLAHTRLGFDFYWLEDWWPLAIVGFGAYILWRNRQQPDER